jgi:hypothetical protein
MGTAKARMRANRLRFADRLMLRLFDIRRTVDTIEVACNRAPEFDRVVAALDFIKKSDPLRYSRLRRDIDRIVVRALPGNWAQYSAWLQAVEIDARHVLSDAFAIAHLASVIVHEATHARLDNLGIGYEEQHRSRIEGVCMRRELAFLKRVRGGDGRREEIERTFAQMPSLTDEAMEEDAEEGAAETLAYLGMPQWLVRPVMSILFPIRRLRQSLRGQRQ